MKKLILLMLAVLLLPATPLTGADDIPEPAQRLLKDLLGIKDKQHVEPVPVEHIMHTVVGGSRFGKVELDQTTHEIVFTAPYRGKMHVHLYREEAWERMDFSIVHTERRHPYRSGITYKIVLTQKEEFIILYFREVDGRVSVKSLL